MSSGEADKIMDVASDIAMRILQSRKRDQERLSQEQTTEVEETNELNSDEIYKESGQKQSVNNDDLSREKVYDEIENQKEILNEFIDNEVTDEKEQTTNLSKEELEGMLNDHFKKVEAALDDFENKNIDADTFKDKLNSLSNHIKANARSKFKTVKTATVKPVKDLKTYAKNKINKFMGNINDRLKNMSAALDKKTGNTENENNKTQEVNREETRYTTNQKGYEQKIENALNNNPDLLKSVLAYSQIKSMNNHIDLSKERLSQLENMDVQSAEEEQKLNDMKLKFQGHINEMESEVNDIQQSYNPEKTSEKLQEATKEHDTENEQNNDKKETKEVTKTKELQMER